MVSPYLPDKFLKTGAPFPTARLVLNEHDAIIGFPAVSLILSERGEPLAAAALITLPDRNDSSEKVWAPRTEQQHVWQSRAGGVPAAALKPLYAVLSAAASLQGVQPVARIGTVLSVQGRRSFPAIEPRESPWGVCINGATAPSPRVLWCYDVTFFLRIALAADDDSTFALDRLTPAVTHAAELAVELSETVSTTTRARLLKEAARVMNHGVAGIHGPATRMKMILDLTNVNSSSDVGDEDDEDGGWQESYAPTNAVARGPFSAQALSVGSRYSCVQDAEVVNLISDSDDDGRDDRRESSAAEARLSATANSASALPLVVATPPTSWASVADVIDSLVPQVSRRHG